MDKQEIETKLRELALTRSTPFCYTDYIKCPSGRYPKCGSDDLMRLSEDGDGPEFGTSWIVEEILCKELTSVDLDEAFEESMRDCYPEETSVGWMKFDTVSVMKEMDPVSWRCAQSEYESEEESEVNIISFDGGCTYFNRNDLENLLDSTA